MASDTIRKKMLGPYKRNSALFLKFSLTCALLLIVSGVALTLVGAGEHMDVLVKRGDLEARFINASPGVVLAISGAVFFWLCRPRITFRDREAESEDVFEGEEASRAAQKPPRKRFKLSDLSEKQKRQIISMSESTGGPSELNAAYEFVQKATRRRRVVVRESTSLMNKLAPPGLQSPTQD